MRAGRKLWLVVFLSLAVAALAALAAMGEITFHQAESGEIEWWYCEQHPDVLCFYDGGSCEGDEWCLTADHYNVELATYYDDDWAYVRLNAERRFPVLDINSLNVAYKNTGDDAQGPSLALAFWDTTDGKHKLLITKPAVVQTNSCTPFDPVTNDTEWYLGEWDGALLSTFDYTTTYATWAAVLADTATTSADEVEAILVVMGIVGTDVFGVTGLDISPGQVVVDFLNLIWDTTYGGVYMLEPAWDEVVTFDDYTQTPLPDPTSEPLEFDKWCQCEDCMPDFDDQNLWGLASVDDLDGKVPAAALAFPSSPFALYFGDKAKGNYDVGEAAAGCICSPFNELNPADEYVSVAFEYFREVEQYDDNYDMTYVQIAFYDELGFNWDDLAVDPFAVTNPGDTNDIDCGEWKTIWYKDSQDPNEGEWTEVAISHYLDADNEPDMDKDARIVIPSGATRMKIRFCFNSYDAASNDFAGWLIDNVRKTHDPDPGCQIETDSLPQGEVGDKYPKGIDDTGFQLEPSNGRWELVSVVKDGRRQPNLPDRLSLSPDGRIFGIVEAGQSGTYEVTVRLLCDGGRPQEKTYILNIVAPTDSESVIFGPDGFLMSPYWENFTVSATCPNLWHEASIYNRVPEVGGIMDDVAAFGKDDAGDPNYTCPGRAKGCLTSVVIPYPADRCGEELIITFKSWLNVEYFTGGEYDRSWIEVKFSGGDWQKVTAWGHSSKDPSPADWTWEEVHTGIMLPCGGKKLQIRFCFDSIDGYNNGKKGETWGWLIDEVTLYGGSAELAITACPRGTTSVGEAYEEELKVSGGSGGVPEWEVTAGALPPGIGPTFEENGVRKSYLSGVARTAGTYQFTLKVTVDGDSATRECTIVVGEQIELMCEDFENDPAWNMTGLWHFTADAEAVTNKFPCLELGADNHAAYYGRPAVADYNTGAVTSGMLTLANPINLLAGPGGTPVTAVKISFNYGRFVEPFGGGAFDKTYLQVKLGAGSWLTVWTLDSTTASDNECYAAVVGFDIPSGTATLQLRFVFDSVDKWYNAFAGWVVDDVCVVTADPAETGPIGPLGLSDRLDSRDTPAELQVINVPNPITDVHTTTFMVRSPDVEAMRIQIFDLAGSLVYEEEISSNELVWHTDNYYGEYLANGIYLYRASVLIGGAWVETTVQKLVILR